MMTRQRSPARFGRGGAGIKSMRARWWGAALAVAALAALRALGVWLGAGPTGFDAAILLGVRHVDPHGRLLGIATDVTALGSGPVLTLLVLAVCGALLVRGAWRSALLLAGASESAGLAADLVKHAVARARPALVPHWIVVGDYSFPSVHSTDSAAVATMLALLAAHRAPIGQRRYAATVAALSVALIGCSRVYLAVHWPSDVLAGWSFGALWALGWWYAAGPSGARE